MYYYHKYGRIFYKVVGEGFPIVHFHGFSLDHRCLSNILEALYGKKNPLKRIYFDLPGMGLSRATEDLQNADHLIELVKDFINEVIGAESYAVLGLSYGAYLLRYFLKHQSERVRSAVMICPVIEPSTSERKLPTYKVYRKDPVFIKSLTKLQLNVIKDMLIVQTPEIWEYYQKDILPALDLVDSRFIDRYATTGYAFREDIDKTRSSIKTEAIFIAGKNDHVVGYEGIGKIINNYENASFHLLAGAGHFLMRERERIFTSIIQDWIKELVSHSGE